MPIVGAGQFTSFVEGRKILPRARVACHVCATLAFKSWPMTRRYEWVSVDPRSAILVKACVQTRESRCAPV